jgi:hypothetical protein
MEDTKDIESSPGVISMMRVALKQSIVVAKMMLIFDALLCLGMFVTGNYALTPVAVSLAVGAPSLFGVTSAAKAVQSKFEQP